MREIRNVFVVKLCKLLWVWVICWIYSIFLLFSALDAESEHLVQDALQTLMKGRTTVIIAHRLSTIKTANQIAVLQNGSIAEIGTYSNLLKKENGIFRQLVERQSFGET